MLPFEIFKPGAYTASNGVEYTFSERELELIADNYDPSVHEAPLVLGHPQTDDPAYGWIKDLKYQRGALWAVPHSVAPALEEAIKAGQYRKVSASFFAAGAPTNPTPQGYYLRHVGILGAAVPAVKGLKPIGFQDGAGVVSFDEPLRTYQDSYAASLKEQTDMLKTQERALRRRETEIELDELARQARISSGQKGLLLAFAETLDDSQIVSFSASGGEATRSGQRKLFFDYLRNVPPMVVFGESASDARDDLADFDDGLAQPDDVRFESDDRRRLAEMLNYQKEYGTSFAEAVKAVNKRRGGR